MKKILAGLHLVPSLSFPQKMMDISKSSLQDKIKGDWAGQVIGVTFGGTVEFRFQGTLINDYQPLTKQRWQACTLPQGQDAMNFFGTINCQKQNIPFGLNWTTAINPW